YCLVGSGLETHRRGVRSIGYCYRVQLLRPDSPDREALSGSRITLFSAGAIGQFARDRQEGRRLLTAFFVCILAFGATYWAGKRSLGQGLLALLTVGYFYGILRANLITIFSHFIFDAGMLGLYLSQKWTSLDPREARRLETLRLWTLVLIAWPLLVALMPFQ